MTPRLSLFALASLVSLVASTAHADPPEMSAPVARPATTAQPAAAPVASGPLRDRGEGPAQDRAAGPRPLRAVDLLTPIHGGPSASPAEAGRASTVDYLRELEQAAHPTYAPGSGVYYRRVARGAFTAWRPPPPAPPSVAQTVVNTVVSPTGVAMNIARAAMGPLATGRGRAAADSLDAAHPLSPTPQLGNTGSAVAEATAREARAEIEVEQGPDGAVRAIRVVRASGEASFDERAVEAVREAIGNAGRQRMPGGWRSRWEFAVTTTRDPLVVAVPRLPGEAPVVTPGWVEVTDDGEVHAPLRAHARRRVRVMHSERIAP